MKPVGREDVVRFFFRPQGRIGRVEFSLGTGFLLCVNFAALIFLLAREEVAAGLLVVLFIAGVPLTVAQLVIVAKRCHDLGLPGSFLLLLFVPFFNVAWLAALAILPGNSGPNAYGAPPRFDP